MHKYWIFLKLKANITNPVYDCVENKVTPIHRLITECQQTPADMISFDPQHFFLAHASKHIFESRDWLELENRPNIIKYVNKLNREYILLKM